jgi:hypothetical protein
LIPPSSVPISSAPSVLFRHLRPTVVMDFYQIMLRWTSIQ